MDGELDWKLLSKKQICVMVIFAIALGQGLYWYSCLVGFKHNVGQTDTALTNAGNAQAKAGHIEKALEYYDKALHANVQGHIRYGKAKTYYNIGEVYFQQGDYEKAVYNFKRSLIYNPREDWPYNRLARIMIKYGEHENAEEVVKLAIYFKPNEKEHRDVFAWLLQRRGAL